MSVTAARTAFQEAEVRPMKALRVGWDRESPRAGIEEAREAEMLFTSRIMSPTAMPGKGRGGKKGRGLVRGG
jgi:hypothetical protein